MKKGSFHIAAETMWLYNEIGNHFKDAPNWLGALLENESPIRAFFDEVQPGTEIVVSVGITVNLPKEKK